MSQIGDFPPGFIYLPQKAMARASRTRQKNTTKRAHDKGNEKGTV